METNILILGSIIIFLAAFLQGTTGFGFSLFSIPLLTLFISPKTAIPMILLVSLIINISVLYNSRKSLNFKFILPIFLFSMIGVPIGAKLLLILPDYVLKIVIGIFILLFGILFLFNVRFKVKHEKVTRAFVGFFSGLLNGSITMSGPPIIIFLANEQKGKMHFRAHLASFFLLLTLFTIPVYLYYGLITKVVVDYALIFSIAVILGVLGGNILIRRIQEVHFRKLTLMIIILMGVLAVYSGIRGVLS